MIDADSDMGAVLPLIKSTQRNACYRTSLKNQLLFSVTSLFDWILSFDEFRKSDCRGNPPCGSKIRSRPRVLYSSLAQEFHLPSMRTGAEVLLKAIGWAHFLPAERPPWPIRNFVDSRFGAEGDPLESPAQ